uniref:Uncharacterized protein n=1 Tax=Chlorocebus sabaeus TaxID=60711 RepID=A0A0D9RM40_CHLSB
VSTQCTPLPLKVQVERGNPQVELTMRTVIALRGKPRNQPSTFLYQEDWCLQPWLCGASLALSSDCPTWLQAKWRGSWRWKMQPGEPTRQVLENSLNKRTPDHACSSSPGAASTSLSMEQDFSSSSRD